MDEMGLSWMATSNVLVWGSIGAMLVLILICVLRLTWLKALSRGMSHLPAKVG
ncbi:hypothetical protein REJC140_03619 [Pseudorhizobium endolithicum]|uniref:Uncharacterized protein n=1 Tax=Pseudorhizobium endolithicum TaxID=1191678 RepID=A0ABN7JLK5_9HYPH|nr:hypothetical protein REQ54_03892 [Rhizobium sp. Q54]CAD7037111.1 hypothetical protein REJC140_03619 [Pseudorhizobium endolithicum]